MESMKKILTILAGTALLVTSCTDLDVMPNSRLTEETVYKDKRELMNGLANVYSNTAYWSEIVYKFGGTTDEMIFPARGADWKGDLQDMYVHNFKPSNGEINARYNEISVSIATSNSLIKDIMDGPFANDADSKQMIAECRFIRAFGYFLMVDYFGNVPLYNEIEYDVNNPPVQANRNDLFNFVESELKALETDLPAKNVYGRVDRFAAKTLLAKLYLNAEVYIGSPKWGEVVTITNDIMTNSNYVLENNYKNVFAWDNYNSKELIFPLVCDSKNTKAQNISYLFSITDLTAKYGSKASGWNGAATLPTFYKAYEVEDVRRQAFLAGPQVDASGSPIMAEADDGKTKQLTYYVDFISAQVGEKADPVFNADHWDGARGVKYLMDGIGGPMVRGALNNDMPILRYADVLLMRAEALFRLNSSNPEALALVNQVRTRNGNNPIAPLVSLTESELLAERGREFAWEGWRRNDLIRFNKFTKAWDYKQADASEHVKLFPIPEIQIQSNYNMKQNPGY